MRTERPEAEEVGSGEMTYRHGCTGIRHVEQGDTGQVGKRAWKWRPLGAGGEYVAGHLDVERSGQASEHRHLSRQSRVRWIRHIDCFHGELVDRTDVGKATGGIERHLRIDSGRRIPQRAEAESLQLGLVGRFVRRGRKAHKQQPDNQPRDRELPSHLAPPPVVSSSAYAPSA